MERIFNFRNDYIKSGDNKSYNKEYYDVNGEKIKEMDYILIEVGYDATQVWTQEFEHISYPIRERYNADSLEYNSFAIHPVIKYRNQLQFRSECGDWISLDGLKFIKYNNNREKVLKYLDELDNKINRQIRNDLEYN